MILDPASIPVVDVQIAGANEILRRDCYDPNGGDVEPGDLLRFEQGELWLHTVDWANAKSMEAEPRIRWVPTGLNRKEVGTIQVFIWPRGKRVSAAPTERMN